MILRIERALDLNLNAHQCSKQLFLANVLDFIFHFNR